MPITAERTASLEVAGADFDEAALAELKRNDQNARVGIDLVSETDRLRVWHIDLEPGERLEFHRHVLNYFWTAMKAGKARSRYGDGKVREFTYTKGETLHLNFGAGETMIHDLTNIGDTPLSFVTVEFLDSPNKPLPLS